MLDAIADFWKPSRKSQNQEKIQPDQMQVGSAIVFGFVPQATLSGRKLEVSAINTYQFGAEALTSFVLTQDENSSVSMIIAESDGEQYLAISRRIVSEDRVKLFEAGTLSDVIEKPDVTQLACKDIPQELKGWLVAGYKRELQGMSGRIFKGDFRKNPLPDMSKSDEFSYTLLVSDNNEHAIEIEKYKDGRIELYATVYRRRSDIGEVSHPNKVEAARPDIKLASVAEVKPAALAAAEPVKVAPIKLQEFVKPAAAPEAVKPVPVMKAEAKTENFTPPKTEEKKTMETTIAAMNGSSKPAAAPTFKQEIKTVTKTNGLDSNESVECELRVANKIIDEAIRNEMRLSDVVRRIVELPVAYQEAVQIPITLSDEDYSLLAIRYGISSSDRNAIKTRIIEDLNNFSGGSAQKKAA